MRHAALREYDPTDNDMRAKVVGLALAFCVLESLFAGAMVFALRLPLGPSEFGIGIGDILRAAGFGFVIMTSLAVGLCTQWRGWIIVLPPMVIGAALLWIGGTFPLLGDVLLVLFVLALIASLARARLTFAGAATRGFFWLVLLALLLALAQVSLLVRIDAGSPFAFERALIGIQHPDTLFHATLAGINAQYGIVSHGLDGLAPFKYHVLSHLFFQQFADWSKLPTLMAYSVFSPVVCFPAMIFTLLSLAATGRRLDRASFDPSVLIATIVMVVMMVSLATLLSFWASESAMVAQWFMLLALIIVGVMARDSGQWKDLPTAILLALLVLLAAKAKISSGAILGAGLGIWYLVISGFRVRGFVYGAAVAALPFLFVLLSTFTERIESGSFGFGMFGFLYVFGFAPILILVVGGLIYTLRKMYTVDGPLERGEAAMRWMIVAMLGFSVFSAAILRLPGVAELYFIGPGIWACFAYFMRDGRAGMFLGGRSQNTRLAILFTLAVIPVLGKGTVHKGAKIMAEGEAAMSVFSTPVTTEGLVSNTVLGRVFTAIRLDPTIETVNIAPDVSQVWQGREPCWAASLAVPALTARPMIAGLPPAEDDCTLSPFYGFAQYDPAASSARTLTDESLCERVTESGFTNVLRVFAEGMEKLDCKD